VVVATFAPDGPERCSGLPICRYDASLLAEEFGRDFDLVLDRRQSHRTPAGVEQIFTWVGLRRIGPAAPRMGNGSASCFGCAPALPAY
jgi:hypothetical protein